MNIDEPSVLTALPVFSRTYSRWLDSRREAWLEVCNRTIDHLAELGGFTDSEKELVRTCQEKLLAITSGRWLWIGGTSWARLPQNYPGAYNCTSTNVRDSRSFGLMMDLAMQGCGTGAVLEQKYLEWLPKITRIVSPQIVKDVGKTPAAQRSPHTRFRWLAGSDELARLEMTVGDSRQGWVQSYQAVIDLAMGLFPENVSLPDNMTQLPREILLLIDLGDVRPAGERLRGFGGIANPAKLTAMYGRVAKILYRSLDAYLNSLDACLLIDEAAVVVVAGNVRRSAGMRQFGSGDMSGANAKQFLWKQDPDTGKWQIDPERDALRMANHTRVFHHKPTLEECIASVSWQYSTGEGAIQYAPEAVARANADLLNSDELKQDFIKAYIVDDPTNDAAKTFLKDLDPRLTIGEINHRLARYGLNPCGEIIGSNFFCNLAEVHLNLIDPNDYETQAKAFRAASLSVAALLNHRFIEARYQQSRELDPIVGVSFTGLFDFFVKAFGVSWLEWWQAGRPNLWVKEYFDGSGTTRSNQADYWRREEAKYLALWKEIVHNTVWDYCDRHGLRRPNRCTTVQPSGTKSLLTGASPGWHPPKAQRYIRRITFGKNDPVALACLDYGFNVIPAQSDKDDDGNLLDDPFDPRCTEWLVEIPVEVPWANLDGADEIDVSRFSALAQFDFYMQVQKHYTTHNTSATIELTEDEVKPLAEAIHQAIENDEGYISAALLARFEDLQTFPRLPFEPITRARYLRETEAIWLRQKVDNFSEALEIRDQVYQSQESGPAGCDSDKCLMPDTSKI